MPVTNDGDLIAIPMSRRKGVLALLGAMILACAGGWIWAGAYSQSQNNPLYLSIVGIGAVLFFGACALYWGWRLFDSRPGLIIDSEGIVDRSSALGVRRIQWPEVIGLRISQIKNVRYVTIDVVDPQRYINQHNSVLRFIDVANMKLVKSPLNISSVGLSVSFERLYELIAEAFKRYCNKDLAESDVSSDGIA